MIVIQLNGGLGNQLFQYAIARFLAEKNKSQIYYDNILLKKSNRNFRLDKFNISIYPVTQKLLKKFGIPIDLNLFRFIPLPFRSGKVIKENGLNYNTWITQQDGDLYLIGYFQSYKYFELIKDLLAKEISLKKEFENSIYEKIEKEIRNEISVSLHVRRGDYLLNKAAEFHGLLTLEYYFKALNYLNNVGLNLFRIFIFSDDINWCKENFKNVYPNMTFVDESLSDFQELMLMSKCKHNIIANSSFSWWAAWLNNNQNKIVIRPAKWFQNLDEESICPESWVKIEN